MILAALFFYLFAGICVASAFMVIAAKNPVHSVLYLILAFVNAAGLFVMMGAEFLAMILIVVYVGAVAVLFLFVVMMLDVDFAELRQGFLNYLPVGALIGIVVLIELLLVVGSPDDGRDVLTLRELEHERIVRLEARLPLRRSIRLGLVAQRPIEHRQRVGTELGLLLSLPGRPLASQRRENRVALAGR